MTLPRSRVATSLVALAAVAMSATPVFARPGPPHPPRHWHRGGGNGGLLAGLLVAGGIAAIAATAASAQNASDQRADPPVDDGDYPPETEEHAQVGSYPGGPEQGRDYDSGPDDRPEYSGQDDQGSAPRDDAPQGGAYQGSFDAAVDACSAELSQSDKHVGSVDSVRRMGDRYSVEGTLDDGHSYACSVDDGGHIKSVAVDGRGMI